MRTYTGSTNCDDRGKKGNSKGKIMVNLKENCRDPEEIERLNQQYIANGKPPKYDISKADMNIYYETCKTTEEAFEHVFGEAMESYNAGQKRSDRKTSMEKELAKLSKGKVKQELIHCMIAQVGNHDSHPPIDECVEILQEYRERFIRQFPNMRIVSCSIHLDELEDGTPHLQMYFIPVKTKEQHEAMGNTKKWSGMDVQPSLTGALEQMGYSNDAKITLEDGRQVHDYKNGAMAQWQRDFNGLLDTICAEHDIEIDHYMRGKQVSHQDTRDYYDGKINQQVMQATRARDSAEADYTQALFAAENAKEEAARLKEENSTLKERNGALRGQNEILEERTTQAEHRAEKAEKKAEAMEQKAADAERKADATEKKAEAMEQRADAAETRLAKAQGAFGRLKDAVAAWVDAHQGLQRVLRAAFRLSDVNRDKIETKAEDTVKRGNKALSEASESVEDLLAAADEMDRGKRVFGRLKQAAKKDLDPDELMDGRER